MIYLLGASNIWHSDAKILPTIKSSGLFRSVFNSCHQWFYQSATIENCCFVCKKKAGHWWWGQERYCNTHCSQWPLKTAVVGGPPAVMPMQVLLEKLDFGTEIVHFDMVLEIIVACDASDQSCDVTLDARRGRETIAFHVQDIEQGGKKALSDREGSISLCGRSDTFPSILYGQISLCRQTT